MSTPRAERSSRWGHIVKARTTTRTSAVPSSTTTRQRPGLLQSPALEPRQRVAADEEPVRSRAERSLDRRACTSGGKTYAYRSGRRASAGTGVRSSTAPEPAAHRRVRTHPVPSRAVAAERETQHQELAVERGQRRTGAAAQRPAELPNSAMSDGGAPPSHPHRSQRDSLAGSPLSSQLPAYAGAAPPVECSRTSEVRDAAIVSNSGAAPATAPRSQRLERHCRAQHHRRPAGDARARGRDVLHVRALSRRNEVVRVRATTAQLPKRHHLLDARPVPARRPPPPSPGDQVELQSVTTPSA